MIAITCSRRVITCRRLAVPTPATIEVLPTVVWSLYPTWDAFVGWFKDATAGFTEPDEQVRRLARELTEGKRTRDEKVQALFGYVADRVRYVNYESAEQGCPVLPPSWFGQPTARPTRS